ncbi:hypothetical protein FRC02_007760 [Tulasnella sp. 418]|nr:hypothetical protein FRC02_007760 [Tulasnella sp. 418]
MSHERDLDIQEVIQHLAIVLIFCLQGRATPQFYCWLVYVNICIIWFNSNQFQALAIAAQYTAGISPGPKGFEAIHTAVGQYLASSRFPVVKQAIKSMIAKQPTFGLFSHKVHKIDGLTDDLAKVCNENMLGM